VFRSHTNSLRPACRTPSLSPEMGVLAGPYVVVAALLVVSGVLKVRRPASTAAALTKVGLRPLAPLAPLVGVLEAVVGIGALTVHNRLFPILVGAFYLAFSAFVGLALTADEPVADCGCFGAAETPPTLLHLLLDLCAAAICGAVALQAGGTLGRALEGQPLLGVPFVLLTGICVFLAYSALTVMPQTRAVARR
jgi:uncharacterized membrane protein YphA (DoxX/SURF4 family)